jgi:hypothetical protein
MDRPQTRCITLGHDVFMRVDRPAAITTASTGLELPSVVVNRHSC